MPTAKVLHIVDKLVPSSGVASVIMNLVEHSGYIQDVVAYSDIDTAMSARVERHAGKVYNAADVCGGFGMPFRRDITDLLTKNNYTVVHGHLLNSAFIYMREAKRRNIPVRIIHSHSAKSANTAFKRIRNDVLKSGIPLWANVFIAGSEPAAINAFGKRPAHIVRNGVDTARFAFNPDVRRAVRNELGISDGDICIGSVARFSPEKNHQFMFRVLERTPRAVGVFAGGGKLPETIAIPKNVKFIGEYGDISRLYQALDVFLLPSLFEGFPVSAVEAQCAGLPCIISDRVTKDVNCGGNVCFLPIDNPDIWAKKIFEATRKQRIDGSAAVAGAGIDIKTMVCDIEKLWNLGDCI